MLIFPLIFFFYTPLKIVSLWEEEQTSYLEKDEWKLHKLVQQIIAKILFISYLL